MEKYQSNQLSKSRFSRRKFLGTLGTTTAGLFITPYLKSANIFAYGHDRTSSYVTHVAITQAETYDRSLIKQKVQYLFETIDGIGDIVKSGNKVAMKINLTGGSGSASSRDYIWTHPEVLRATGELIIDSGVSPGSIYIVEALWDNDSYNKNGYLDVQNDLGVKMVDLNKVAPYTSFIKKEVGDKKISSSSFTVNQILQDVDVYVSIPKMKQHSEGGVTCSLKNQIGMVPKQLYTTSWDQSRRDALHRESNTGQSTAHLPDSICDLNLARPVHLAVVDGVMNARGGEGPWNPTFKTAEDHVLLSGKDPVAVDSIAAYFMGNDPEADKIQLPGGGECDNYLSLLHQRDGGTNQMSEIEVVGDGKDLITSVRPDFEVHFPKDFRLLQNFPNPFNPSTTISFYLPRAEFVTVIIYNELGQNIGTLVQGQVPAGHHELHWSAETLASGVYLCRMTAGNFSDTKKLIYQK